jgi:hypothetical protein
MKEYLKCKVTTKGGTTFDNPLKLSEANLIPQMLKENKCVLIERVQCSKEQYQQIFG